MHLTPTRRRGGARARAYRPDSRPLLSFPCYQRAAICFTRFPAATTPRTSSEDRKCPGTTWLNCEHEKQDAEQPDNTSPGPELPVQTRPWQAYRPPLRRRESNLPLHESPSRFRVKASPRGAAPTIGHGEPGSAIL